MKRAIEIALQANTAFAAVLIDEEGRILEEAVNTTNTDGSIAHAEINLIIKAEKTESIKRGTTLVTTCEPCPMCIGAIIWSGIDSVVFGTSIVTASEFLPQIMVSAESIAKKSFRQLSLQGPFMETETVELFRNN